MKKRGWMMVHPVEHTTYYARRLGFKPPRPPMGGELHKWRSSAVGVSPALFLLHSSLSHTHAASEEKWEK